MPTQRKIDRVKALEERLRRCTIAVSTEFRGLTVADMAAVRRRLREQGIEYVVVKNTLAAIAGENAGKPGLRQILHGPTAIAFGYGELVEPPKALVEHIRASRLDINITGAIADHQVMSGTEVRALAGLPPRPVLISQMAGSLLAPLRGLAYALTYHTGALARALEARRKQLEEGGS